MTAQHVPTRSEIPELDKWDLTNLFADVSKWQEDFAWLQQTYPKLQDWKGRVGESAQTLADWRIKLHKIRRMKSHVLSEPEERLLALSRVALSGYDDTFSQLTDVDMKFGVLTNEPGREKPLTQNSFSSFLVKRDHELRKRAFHQFYAEFQDHQYTLATSLAYSVKADVFRSRARNYSSALEAALFPDDVPVAVCDNLIKSVRSHLDPLFRYFELRRRVLGLDELHHYDTYVPLVLEIETHISFDDAVETVLDALGPLGKEYVDVL